MSHTLHEMFWRQDGIHNLSYVSWILGIKLSYLIYKRCKLTCSFPDRQTSQKPHQAFTEVTLNALKARQIHESILIIQKVRLIFGTAGQLKSCLLSFRWDICPQTRRVDVRVQYVRGGGGGVQEANCTYLVKLGIFTPLKRLYQRFFLEKNRNIIARVNIIQAILSKSDSLWFPWLNAAL